MILLNGYTIEHHPKQNVITIGLPQTMLTATSTQGAISSRKDTLSENELTKILVMTKSFFESEQQQPGQPMWKSDEHFVTACNESYHEGMKHELDIVSEIVTNGCGSRYCKDCNYQEYPREICEQAFIGKVLENYIAEQMEGRNNE